MAAQSEGVERSYWRRVMGSWLSFAQAAEAGAYGYQDDRLASLERRIGALEAEKRRVASLSDAH